MSYVYGYHRVSSKEQHLDRGIREIEEYCDNHNIKLQNIYTDKISGKSFNRPRYTVLIEDVLRPGDTLIVSELDRLGRNKMDTMKQIQYFKDNNIRLMVLELPTTLIDLSVMDNNMAKMVLETTNNMMLELYACIAQAEMDKRIKRQSEGIQSKRERGEWDEYGRPRKMRFEDFKIKYDEVVAGKKRPFELMRELELKTSTFYRYKKIYEEVTNKISEKEKNLPNTK